MSGGPDLGRISTLIEIRYREHSARMRSFWNRRGPGPRLEVVARDENHADMRMRGRSVTLANRTFQWDHDGGDGTLLELLGHPSSGKALDAQLLSIATAQALRATVARAQGVGKASADPTDILVDRTAAAMLARDRGIDTLRAVALGARLADRFETVPNEHQTRLANGGDVSFAIMPCEVDVATNSIRPPEIRLPMMPLGGGMSYVQGRLHVANVAVPETLMVGIAGRRLGDVVETGDPLIDDRTIASASNVGNTFVVRLTDEMVSIREIAR